MQEQPSAKIPLTASSRPKLGVLCAGLDSKRRGYETHQRLLFESLRSEGNSVVLIKRDGPSVPGAEIPLRTPRSGSMVCRLVGVIYESPLQAQMAFFALGFVLYAVLTRQAFHRLFVIEPGVCRILSKCRRLIPGSPKIVYTHGISDGPEYYARFADEIIEVNEPNFLRAKQFVREGMTSVNVHLIPHFVRNLNAPVEASRRIEARRRLGIEEDRVIAHVGVVSCNPKRVDYIIRECSQLPDEWHLLLIGDVIDHDLLVQARSLMPGRVTQLSLPREEVTTAIRAADFAVLASYNEGFGLAILEALNESVPILLPDIRLYRWIMKNAAPVVDMRTDGELARAILREWPSRDEIAHRCRRVLARHYTWEAVKQKYGRIIAP